MNTPLPSGTSELDTVVLRLPDSGLEVPSWSRYQFNRRFLTPTAEWSFVLDDADPTLTASLAPGVRVQLVVRGRVQCSGTIDRRQVSGGAKDGTSVTLRGRDILGKVVDATMDPAFKFTATLSVPQFVAAVLAPFNVGTIYNSDAANLNVMTGYPAGKGGSVTQIPTQTPNVVDDATGKTVLTFTPGPPTRLVQYTTRPDLTTLTVQDSKPHHGEGVFAYLERILLRLGLTLWALADGSGVVIDEPDFTSPPQYQIVRKRSDPTQNNVEWGEVVIDRTTQPSCIVAFGFGSGANVAATRIKVIMVNELVGVANGQPIPSAAAIIARYKGALVLPLRSQLTPLPNPGSAIPPPFFLKDDEAKNTQQLAAFVRRKMAELQSKALVGSYELAGHSQAGHPWSVNTSASVTDEVGGLAQTMWIQEVTLSKSTGPGTRVQLKTILPYTLQLGSP
jgi:prophage tail gpP-like protein